MGHFVKIAVQEHIAVITLDKPPVNAICRSMIAELTEVFDSLHQYPGPKVALLIGAGDRAFCAGADLNAGDGGEWETEDHGRSMRSVLEALYECPIPVIAAINGPALGGGLTIAASCDYIIAAERASFGLPEIDLGVLGGARHAAQLFPMHTVRRMQYSAEKVSAKEAFRLGALQRVVPDNKLLEEALSDARLIARKMPMGLRLAKENLNTIEWMDVKNGYRFEQTRTDMLVNTDDAKEARDAFMEKRQPQFTGY